ncbi:MAG TPA: HNH endonuclease signature motif containing protein [Candidatus Saccharimonadales bacterium]
MSSPCIDYGGVHTRAPYCKQAWEKINGPVPKGMFICHSCDNARCRNVEHFFLGTNRDNVIDSFIKDKTASAKLNAEKVREIRNSKDDSFILSKRYGVSAGAIRDVKRGITWKFIT